MKECLKDFKLCNKVSTEIIEKYKNRVPNEMIDIWSNYGFGTFMQGYFKSVNPDEFKLILEESSQRYKHEIVLFAIGMKDINILSDGNVRVINYRHVKKKHIKNIYY